MKYRYYVVVNDPQHKASVHFDLINNHGTEFIPARRVAAVDQMTRSEYNGVYMLTAEEAEQLINDPRVNDVERAPEDLGINPMPHAIQTGTFVKYQSTLAATDKNWGLARGISRTENFGILNTATTFTYNLDGSGVDVVIVDTGIIKYHPEFSVNADGTGGTRVVDINWSQFGVMTGITSSMGDNDGHGTNCASISCGNTNGWAKGAAIYAINILDNTLPSYTDPVSAFQTIRLWHNAKPIDPNTGYKRPTVVNNSWGYALQYANMTATVWRGTTYPATVPASAYGQVTSDGSAPAANNDTTTFGYRSSSIEAEIASCITAGIIFVGSAGNQAMKVDVPGGTDYNNRWIDNTGASYYYHRGTTPSAATNVVCVGATSYSTPEHKISFSNSGPRVDVFAPGAAIMGGYTNSSYGGQSAVVDTRSGNISTSTTATFYLNKISGTSQAGPQITGIVACLLQSRPWLKQWQVQQWVQEVASTNTLDETFYGGSGYTQYAGLQGAVNRQMYQPFNDPNPWSISSS